MVAGYSRVITARMVPTRTAEDVLAGMWAMVPPVVGWRNWLRLPRDHYVRVDANDYSVDPTVVGRRVEVAADLEQVRVFAGSRLVARHDRCWAGGQTITDPAHRDAATALRRARRLAPVSVAETEVQQRNLADYDRITGVEMSTVDVIGAEAAA